MKKLHPLLVIFVFSGVFALVQQLLNDWSAGRAAVDFLGSFLLMMGLMELVRAPKKISVIVFSILEVALGILFFLRFFLPVLLGIMLALLLAKAIVYKRKTPIVETIVPAMLAILMFFSLGKSAEYTVEYTREHLQDSQVALTFQIIDEWGAPLTDYEIEHEKPMHLIGVRTDLNDFLHLHPEMDWDGTWRTVVDFPSDGPYQFYADFVPKGGEKEVVSFGLSFGEFNYEKLGYYENPQEIEGYTIEYMWPKPVATGTEVQYSLQVKKGEEVFTAFEDYLGAKGHSVIVQEDTLDYLHVHSISEHDPAFAVTFDEPGRYAVFTQIQLEGRVLMVPTVLSVE